MSVFTWGSRSKAETEVVQGSTIGTLKLRVSDEENEVRDILFNEVAIDAADNEVRRSGPYPPDITRRPGWYEKDVVLDASLRTRVEVILRGEGGAELLGPVTRYEVFGVRAPNMGGTGEVRVKGANTGPTAAETLSIEGATVTVDNRVATFNLDGRYATPGSVGGALASYYTKVESDTRYSQIAHTHPYLPLAGGVMSERLQVEKNTVDPDFRTGHLELRTTNGSAVAVGFHRSMFSAVTLRHGVLGALDLVDHSGVWAQYRGSSFWAVGNRFHGGDGAFIDLTNGAAQFLTGGGGALQARVGGVLVSDSYGDAPSVPSIGIYSKGGARLGPYIDVGIAGFRGAIRRPDGAGLNLQNGGAGVLNVGDVASSYKLNVQGDVYAQGGWLRTNDTQGWYNETYGGGINMEDSTWVRVSHGRGFLVPGNIKTHGAIYGSGAAVRLTSDNSYWYATTANGMQFYGIDGGRKGFLYHDVSSFGLLHGGGDWAVRTWIGGGQLHGGWSTDGAFGANRFNAGYDSGFAGSVNASNWFRSNGSTGWYNATHNTGLYADQSGYVRTYGQSGIQVGGNGLVAANPVESDTTFGLYFSADRSPAYAVSRAAGGWSSPHPALRIAFHSGIQIGASSGNGGTRFYGSWDMANELMSVGKGDGDVRIANGLAVSGDLRVFGTPTDVYGNQLAAIVVTSAPPAADTVGRVGTLYVMAG